MPTTLTNLPFTRRTALGLSSAAQGADGTTELTRTALAALSAAAWTDNPAPPTIPVHEFERPAPSGDAFKACYGYDATARTQRAAAGAVCYTFALPSASGQTIDALTATITGDRYLDAGVDVHVVVSATATPPTVAELLARTPDATLCATGDQTATPNNRRGIVSRLDLADLGNAAAYLHIALLLHDYLGVRGAWIEGGAMLDPATVEPTFSGTVTPPARPQRQLVPVAIDKAPLLNRYWEYIGVSGSGTSATVAGAVALTTIVISGSGPLAAAQNGGQTLTADNKDGFSVTALDNSATSPLFAYIAYAGSSATASNLAVVAGSCSYYDGTQLQAGDGIVFPNDSGPTTIRIIAVEITTIKDVPDWTNPLLWAGAAPECIGVAEFATSSGGTLRITRKPQTPFVALVAIPTAASAWGQYDGVPYSGILTIQ